MIYQYEQTYSSVDTEMDEPCEFALDMHELDSDELDTAFQDKYFTPEQLADWEAEIDTSALHTAFQDSHHTPRQLADWETKNAASTLDKTTASTQLIFPDQDPTQSKWHPEVHSKTAEAACDLCPRAYATTLDRRVHKINFHAPQSRRRYKCAVAGCGAGYFRKKDLSFHARGMHSKNSSKKYTCGECQKSARDKVSFEKHLWNDHHVYPSFFCECGKDFMDNVLRDEHCGLEGHKITGALTTADASRGMFKEAMEALENTE